MRGQNTFHWQKLEGWLDIELFFTASKDAGPIPEWLVGWWKVDRRGQTSYYYFDRKYQAKSTQVAPYAISQPPMVATDTGSFLPGPIGVTIQWGTGAVTEFRCVDWADHKLMAGAWNGVEPLLAMKMRSVGGS
jgi:hypothetical protein